MRKIPVERFWLDHFLAIASGVMALYAIARSIGAEILPNVLAISLILAGLAGYGLSLIIEDTPLKKSDGWFFATAAILGIFQTRTVNGMLPEEGFPFAIVAATMMFILLIAGALFSWSDATLLFMSLPSLVLFGLVGTIDSWRPGLFLFCGMILCIALLYARVHQRTMIRWAEEGGADRNLLHRDVWRWVAGPEYAFVAAGTIILLSFLGAPVVQTSLTGVSDAVRVNVRTQFRSQLQNRQPNQLPRSEAPIGSGPVNLSTREVARVKIPRPIYLRRNVYIDYRRNGWNSGQVVGSTAYDFKKPGKVLEFRRTNFSDLKLLSQIEEIPYEFTASGWPGDNIPTPGAVLEIESLSGEPMETSAHSIFFRQIGGEAKLNSIVAVPTESQISTRARFPGIDPSSQEAQEYYAYPNVSRWEDNPLLARTDLSDYDRLLALQQAIAAQSKYNTQTPATPRDKDPVGYFLNESKMGYCDLFASAFALEARRMGYPARYVTGFLMDSSQRQPDGTYAILEKHSHSWAEVYFEDYGWIPFDATSGAEDISPKDNESQDNSALAALTKWISANLGPVVGTGGLILLAFVYFLNKNRGMAVGSSDANRPIRVLASRFQLSLEKIVGSPKRFSQTHREFVESHPASTFELKNQIEEILLIVEKGFFSSNKLSSEELSQLGALVLAFEKECKRLEKERKHIQKRKVRSA